MEIPIAQTYKNDYCEGLRVQLIFLSYYVNKIDADWLLNMQNATKSLQVIFSLSKAHHM